MIKKIEINYDIYLIGKLSVKDLDTDKILIQQQNQITNWGAKQIAIGNGVKNIAYLAVGRGLTPATLYDKTLENEINRYAIEECIIVNGVASLRVIARDNLIMNIEEWGLFYNDLDKDSSSKNTGILFSRTIAHLQRYQKQKLMIEWQISLT